MLASQDGDPVDLITLRAILDAGCNVGPIPHDAKAGTFEYRPAPEETLALSAGCARILGIDETELHRAGRRPDWVLSRVHPEDLHPLMVAAASLRATGPSQRVQLRVQHCDGQWVRLDGLVRSIAGAPLCVVGLVWELTTAAFARRAVESASASDVR